MSEILLFLISKYFELIGKFFVLLSQIFRAAPRSLKEYEKMWFYVESCENLEKKGIILIKKTGRPAID